MSAVKIHSQFLDNVEWRDGTFCDKNIGGRVDTWRIKVGANLPLIDNFLSLMNPSEIARANRFLQQKDKNRFIVSRGALRIIIGQYTGQSPPSIQFLEGPNKKPFIANSSIPLYYNISHSGDWLLLAVSSSEVGADVEFINPEFDYREVIEETFNTAEADLIKKNNIPEIFYLLWTRKEALLKATSKGLDDQLKAVPGLDGEHFVESNIIGSNHDWNLKSFKLSEQYLGAIAFDSLISDFSFWDVDLKPKLSGPA